jgi:uncharacterized protein YegL
MSDLHFRFADYSDHDFEWDELGINDTAMTQRNIREDDGITRSCMNLVFLLDTSGSMNFNGGHRINQLNAAMPIVLNAVRNAATEEDITLFIRVISFNDQASWVMGSMEKGVPVEDACNNWWDLSAAGSTDTAAAIRLACTAMRTKYLGTRSFHPVVILITDGESNNRADTQNAIEELRNALSGGTPAKKDKVWRFAIGVEDYNEAELVDFAMKGTLADEFGNELPNEPMIFKVDNVTNLVNVLKNTTVGAIYSACHPIGG